MHATFSHAAHSVAPTPPRQAVAAAPARSGCQQHRASCRATTLAAGAAGPALKLDAAFKQPPAMPAVGKVAQAAPPQFPALLSAAGRTPDEVAAEVQQQLQSFPQALVQGVEPEMYASMRKLLGGVQYQARARVAVVKPKPEEGAPAAPPKQRRLPGMVCVVSAGPEDQACADQVKLMAEHLGCFVTAKPRLSVRDLPALMDQLPALQAADVVIAVAGIDANLPGAVAGMVDAPVIALPTSAAQQPSGLAGLGGLLAAASAGTSGMSVVGIDQAAAAASMAARILRTAAARVEKLTAAAAAAAPANGNGNGTHAAANNVVPTMLDSLSLHPAALGPVGSH